MLPNPSQHNGSHSGLQTSESSSAASLRCRLCDEPLRAQAWGGAECPRCESVSVNELPSANELASYYQSYVETYQGGGASAGANLMRYAKLYAKLTGNFAPKTDGGLLDIVDVGSSNSPFPNLMAEKGHRVTVVDFVRPKGLHSAVRFMEGHLGDSKTFSRVKGCYDVVTGWAVLEHVTNPAQSVAELCAMARPNGRVLVSTPEHGTVLTRWAIGRSAWFFPPEHLHLISGQALQKQFSEHNMRTLAHGRCELNLLRWVARYGIGALETCIGAPVKLFAPRVWTAARHAKTHRFKGISWFAFGS